MGQTQKRMGTKIYPSTTPGCCPAGSDDGSDGVEPTSGFFYQKPSDHVLHIMPNASCGYAVKTWSAVCSMATQSQSGKKARLHCA